MNREDLRSPFLYLAWLILSTLFILGFGGIYYAAMDHEPALVDLNRLVKVSTIPQPMIFQILVLMGLFSKLKEGHNRWYVIFGCVFMAKFLLALNTFFPYEISALDPRSITMILVRIALDFVLMGLVLPMMFRGCGLIEDKIDSLTVAAVVTFIFLPGIARCVFFGMALLNSPQLSYWHGIWLCILLTLGSGLGITWLFKKPEQIASEDPVPNPY